MYIKKKIDRSKYYLPSEHAFKGVMYIFIGQLSCESYESLKKYGKLRLKKSLSTASKRALINIK